MAVSNSAFETEIGTVIVAIFVVLVAVYALYRYLRRRGPELATREGRSVIEDRAYNQIRIGQAAADRLARMGVDVTEAQELLRRAETARLGGDYDNSIDLSRRSTNLLAAARTGGGPLPSSEMDRPSSASAGPRSIPTSPTVSSAGASSFAAFPTISSAAEDSGRSAESGSTPTPGSNRAPKNKMEAHFQLSVCKDELDHSRAGQSEAQSFRDAEKLYANGQTAYDREDYTEALRLALKGRRTLGTRVEALPVTATSSSTVSSARTAAARAAGPVSDEPTFGQKCANCGRIAGPADQFCRECGAPMAPVLCTNCGTPLLAGDRFCGKCGATQT
jgi:double zinc ribbon protein